MRPTKIGTGVMYMSAAGLMMATVAGQTITLQQDPRARPPKTAQELLEEMQEERERDEPTFGPSNRAERRAQKFGR